MKYKIIWIDDSRDWVNSIEVEIKEYFEDKEFEVVIHKFQDVESSREIMSETYIDLILIDYGLPGMKGDKYIQELRLGRCFAHIVFYSRDINKVQLFEEDKHFIHVTDRDGISNIMEDVSDHAYRKYHHPAFMRGLLLSEFIDLENLMEDLISSCFDDKEEYFKETIIRKGGEAFSLMTKQKFILRLIKNQNGDVGMKKKLDAIAFTSSKFNERIIKRRNVLAHAHPDYSVETARITLKSSIVDVEFNGDWFHETREHIHEYKNKIKKLHALNIR